MSDTTTSTTTQAPLAQLRDADLQSWLNIMHYGQTSNPSTARLMHALAASLLGRQDVARQILIEGPYRMAEWPVLTDQGPSDQGHLNLIVATDEADQDDDGRQLYWNDPDGWGAFEYATVYPDTERVLPLGGAWLDSCHPDES